MNCWYPLLFVCQLNIERFWFAHIQQLYVEIWFDLSELKLDHCHHLEMSKRYHLCPFDDNMWHQWFQQRQNWQHPETKKVHYIFCQPTLLWYVHPDFTVSVVCCSSVGMFVSSEFWSSGWAGTWFSWFVMRESRKRERSSEVRTVLFWHHLNTGISFQHIHLIANSCNPFSVEMLTLCASEISKNFLHTTLQYTIWCVCLDSHQCSNKILWWEEWRKRETWRKMLTIITLKVLNIKI